MQQAKRRGRKKLPDGAARSASIKVLLTPAERDAFMDEASMRDCTMSDLMRAMILEELAARVKA